MKIYLLIFAIALFCSFGVTPNHSSAADLGSANVIGGSFKILNDSGGEVQIHTGSGFVELNKGASTSVSCDPGKVISLADKGKKKDALFTVDESMCGKTVKLSKYL